ncbi:Ni/Fe hydrogenase subunit alpha [bacterium]|nr:Ni/Fe hydrogenase subunit alpha [bacterium]
MREILVEPLARVEGDGGITIRAEGKKVHEVRFDILEGTRLVETLVIGKTPEEDVSITCRICAICTLSHRYAALRGLEKALGIEVPPKVQALRSLMHLGELLESHSLHVFLLALPDFLGYPNAVAMAEKYGPEVVQALALKKFANHVMTVTSGRMIHGENPTVGGFGKYPEKDILLDIARQAQAMIPFAEKAVGLIAGLSVPDYFEDDTVFMCCEPGDDGFGLMGDRIRISDGKVVDAKEYRTLTNEKFSPHSAAKHCLYQGKPYTVGAIARCNNLGERMNGLAGKLFKKHWNKRWLRNPVFNNLAQAIEMVWALEQVSKTVDAVLQYPDDPPIVKPTRQSGEGVGSVEAPRGTLYHAYRIQDGLVAEANLIIPTGQSLEDIEKYMRKAVEILLSQGADDSAIRLQAEIIVRAFDPCISCSTHMVRFERHDPR